MRHKAVFAIALTVFALIACPTVVGAAEAQQVKGDGPKPAQEIAKTHRKQLTSGVVDDRSPCWSPDGKLIAFQRDWQIWVMNADGTNQRQLTKGPHKSGFPAWSPDGKLIAFHSNRRGGQEVDEGGNWDLWLMDKDGELAKLLAGDKGNEEFPYWSPDGKRISFHYRRMGPGHEVYVIDLEGNVVGHPTIGDRDDVFPMWSPDGKRFVVASAEPGELEKHTNIFVMDVDGQNRSQLTDGEHFDFRPCWSPDGAKIAFQSNRSGTQDLWTVDVKTRKLERLTTAAEGEVEPWWAPDGKSIVYSLRAEKGAHICVLTFGEPSEKK